MKRSILIVDDMDINREILAEAFRDKYEILEADNGNSAMKYIEDKSIDIAALLLDLVMPGQKLPTLAARLVGSSVM